MSSLKDMVVDALMNNYFTSGFAREDIETLVERPKQKEHSDFAFPCFQYAKEWGGTDPHSLAEEIKDMVGCTEIYNVSVVGGYVNFKFNDEFIVSYVLKEVEEKRESYGSNDFGKGKTVVIDYSAPNLGKPMHVGHVRSTILGDSIIKLLEFSGYNTHGINYLGDIGLHIGKLIAAYGMWGDEERLAKEPEHEMFDLYVRFSAEEADDEKYTDMAKDVLNKLEAGDSDLVSILERIMASSMDAFQRVYDLLDVKFDETSGQSAFSDKGKEIIYKALEDGLVERRLDAIGEQAVSMEADEDLKGSAIVADLKQYNLPDKVVLRSDGSAIYSTQDIGAVVERYETHKFDRMLYVVAQEQETYFKQIFAILNKLGYSWSKDCKHVKFGLINLEGGRMSTREGTVVFLEDVLGKAINIARTGIQDDRFTQEEKEAIAEAVGTGAIKYMVLSVDPLKTITFSWERAMNFEDNSGPYIQYTLARAHSLISKSKLKPELNPNDIRELGELNIVRKIEQFPEIVEAATQKYGPHIVANYLNELSREFNGWYQKVKVHETPEEQSRLSIVNAIITTLENGMNLLGIRTLEKM